MNTILSNKDQIYVTSWAAYNEGRNAGGWFALADLAPLTIEEIFDKFRTVNLDPEGRDEELVVHDFDDYTGIGYYELFGEPYPMTVIHFYNELEYLDDDELLVFIGLRETQADKIALEALENNELENWVVFSEDTYEDIIRDMVEASTDKDFISRYLDWDKIKSDLEDAYYYNNEVEDYEVEDDEVEEFIEASSAETLSQFFDYDAYERDLSLEGIYTEFNFDDSVYYISEN